MAGGDREGEKSSEYVTLQFQYLQYIIQYQTILQFDEAIFIHLNPIFIHLNPIGDFSSVI